MTSSYGLSIEILELSHGHEEYFSKPWLAG
jgi:hypothetical protein